MNDLNLTFAIIDLGFLSYFPSVTVCHIDESMFLSQQMYVKDFLDKYDTKNV